MEKNVAQIRRKGGVQGSEDSNTSFPTRSRHSATFDWRVLEEDEEWDTSTTTPDRTPPLKQSARRRLDNPRVITTLLIVVVVGIAGTGYLWWMAETGAQALEEEVRSVVAAEQGQAPRPSISPTNHGLSETAATRAVQAVSFYGALASVQVETEQIALNQQSYRHRQRIFFEYTANGWQRVPTNDVHWGPRQRLETKYFTFIYDRLDAAAVQVVAADVDAIYLGLRQDYGLPDVAERIEVEMITGPSLTERYCFVQDNGLCIQSPALALLPHNVTEIEALRLWLLNALVYQVRSDAREIEPMRYTWQAAAIALPRKQLREHSELLSAWYTDFTRWHYANEARMLKSGEDMSTEALEPLCEKHKIVASPQLFAEGFSTEMCVWPHLFPSLLGNRTPTNRLAQLRVPHHDYYPMVDEIVWRQVLAFETLFDYVAITYGRDALPALVEGFRRYDSWIELIPAVFYVSAEEFEQGWQAYLVEISSAK